MRFLTAFLLLFFQTPGNPAPQGLQQEVLSSIEGTVLAAASGDPLARAEVTLTRLAAATPAIAPVSTERDGKFVFRNLQPGQYLLRVKRNGYAPQEYGQRTPTSSGPPIPLTAGQQMKDVVFNLVAGAVVAGRVRDTGGEPVPSVTVSLLRTQYQATGQRTYYVVGSATTDDRGEYRVFWVPAGRYMVSLSPASETAARTAIRDQYVFSDRIFPMMYYPGTTDPTRATAVELKAGDTLSTVDFTVNPPRLFSVRGRVIDSTTGKPAASASVTLEQRQEQPSAARLRNSAFSAGDGTFEIRDVIPGTYWVRSLSNSNGAVNPATIGTARTSTDLIEAAISNRLSAQMPLDVSDSNIEGFTVLLSPPVSIPLHLSAEGQEVSSISGYDRVRIQLRSGSLSSPSDIVNQRNPFSSAGASVMTGVTIGEYRIFLLPIPDLYIRAVTLDGIDVLNRPFQVTSSTATTPLNIVVSGKPGQVEGNLFDALSQPVKGNSVVLIPDQLRDRADLYKTAQTDQSGHFVIRGIPPGGYKLFAWEALESNSYYDREVLSVYEAQGKPVRLQESSKETVDLRIISAPK
jgi:5-hydroxyisourate hydrolase-like protein (transthyretin family)